MRERRTTILITGGGGICGSIARRELGQDYDLRVTDLRPVPDWPGSSVLDVRDLEGLIKAAQGVEQIIHMAAIPHDDTFENLLAHNIVGTYHVYEAARHNNVRRVIFFSTNHVTGGYEQDHLISHPHDPIRPDSLYGASKAWGEILGRLYSDRYGISVICLRLGLVLADDAMIRHQPRNLHRWLSHRDLAQLLRRCVGAPYSLHFLIAYGVSNQPHSPWDISNAREVLGYDPQDNGELYLTNSL